VNNYAVGLANGINFLKLTSSSSVSYTLPEDGNVGNTIEGQAIFPTFNNNARYTPEKCEVDYCNEHVGQGGGIPHLHGDPFGPNCLYSARNYSSLSAHPPHIGYSLDGYLIYGRHLAGDAEGYCTVLDNFVGHIHSGYAYHYHTQVLQLTVTTAANVPSAVGTSYMATTVGPYMCWKADLNQQPYFPFNMSSDSASYSKKPCCGTTAYYKASYITLSSTQFGTQSTSSAAFTSTCGVSTSTVTTASTTTPSSTANDDLKIGLGVGVGAGVPLLIVLVYFLIPKGNPRASGKLAHAPQAAAV